MIKPHQMEMASKKRLFFAGILAILIFAFTPVYANAIVSLISSILVAITSFVCGAFLTIIEKVLSIFIGVIRIDIPAATTQIEAFEAFALGIQYLGTGLAVVLFLFQFFGTLFSPFTRTQPQSIMGIITRGLVFIPLTYFIKDILLVALCEFQKIYSAFMSDADIGQVSNIFSSQTGAIKSIIDSIGGNPADAVLASVATTVLSFAILGFIGWNFIKLLFEAVQRFVAMIVYTYLSPLAIACGTSVNTAEIAKKGLTLFISSGILWILNVWCVGLGLTLIGSLAGSVSSLGAFIAWAGVTYGFMKIAQQMDDVFNAVGATNVRLSGSMLTDMLEMKSIAGMAAGMAAMSGGLANFAANGFGGGAGISATNSAANPMGAETATRISNTSGGANAGANVSSNSGAKATNGASWQEPRKALNPDGSIPKNPAQQFARGVAGFVGNTPPGQIARGIVQTGKNLGASAKSAYSAGATEAKLAKSNAATSGIYNALSKPTPEKRAEAIKGLVRDNPQALRDPSVASFVGEAMGLEPNQSIVGLSQSNGEMSAKVATIGEDGNVKLSQVSGLNNLDREKAGGSLGTGKPPEPAKTTTINDAATALSASTPATLSYKDVIGNDQSAMVSKGKNIEPQSDGKGSITPRMSSFTMSDGEGQQYGSPITVPASADMTPRDIAEAIGSSNDSEAVTKFKDAGGDMRSLNSARSQSTMGNTGEHVVNDGAVWENREGTMGSIQTPSGTSTIARVGSDGDKAVWEVQNPQGEALRFAAEPTESIRSIVSDIATNPESPRYETAADVLAVDHSQPVPLVISSQAVEGATSYQSGTHNNGSVWADAGEITIEPNGSYNRQASNDLFNQADDAFMEETLKRAMALKKKKFIATANNPVKEDSHF